MIKPPSMSIKEYLIKKIAVNKVISNRIISEKVIDMVISHQFDSASAATALNNSIEISGFGKFVFNEKRGLARMKKYDSQMELFSKIIESETISGAERRNTEMRIETVQSNIKALKPKLNGFL